jgi:hypothetical protein
LHWLRITEHEVLLDAKYIVDGPRRPAALTLNIDPAWELLTATGAPISNDSQSATAGFSAIRVPVPEDYDHRCEVDLQFRLRAALLPGILRLPPIEPASLPVTERWLAVTASPEVESQVIPTAVPHRDTNEFLARWQGTRDGVPEDRRPGEVQSNPAPQIALALDGKSHLPSLAIRPRFGATRIQDRLQVAADINAWRLSYQAQVTPTGKHMFQLPLRVLPELSIDSVTIDCDGESIPLRYARSAGDECTLFFGEQMTRPFRVLVAGHVSRSETPDIVPVMALRDRPDEPLALALFRAEGIQLNVPSLQPFVQVGAADEPAPADWSARPVGVYQLPPSRFNNLRVERIIIRPPSDVAATAQSQLAQSQLAQSLPKSDVEESLDPKSPRPGVPAARVRLADSIVTQDATGNMQIATRLIVISPAPASLELQLPAAHRLAELRINGEPIAAAQPVEGRIGISLGAPALPQIVEIVSLTKIDPTRDHLCEQPVLLVDEQSVHAEMTLWCVKRSLGTQPPKFYQTTSINAYDFAALRLDRWISIVESATPAATDLARPEVVEWANAWARHFARWQLPERLGETRPLADAPQPSLVPDEGPIRLAETGQRIADWHSRFTTADSPTPTARLSEKSALDDNSSAFTAGDWAHVASFAAGGPVESIRMNAIHDTRFLASRPAALIVLACLTVAALGTAGRPTFWARIRRPFQSRSS